MGRHIDDITGQRFGKLTALKLFEVKNNSAYWLCRCDCGTLKTIRGRNLRSGATVSCGCIRSDAALAYRQRLREERMAAAKLERERKQAEIRQEEFRRRQMIRNQEAGMDFDDFWMFGHDGKAYWDRVTSSTQVRQSP
ncbi:MAG: hypothetical protein IJL58_05350 [Bacteroidales bacterium]|nr:hypothetical protein [Bacteroidales bacterium]